MNEEYDDLPIDRYGRVLKEKAAWNVAIYATRRAISFRDAREELLIETVAVCGGRAARLNVCEIRASGTRRRRDFELPADSRGKTMWIRPSREERNSERDP